MSSFDRDDLPIPNMTLAVGPTGSNGEFVEGDIVMGPGGPSRLGPKEVIVMNKRMQDHKEKVALANMTRVNYAANRRCTKCGSNDTPAIHYQPPEADCQEQHGSEEHLDRQCVRCHYTWAENILEDQTYRVMHRCGAHPTANLVEMATGLVTCQVCLEKLRVEARR